MADDVTKYSNRLERQRTRGLKYGLDAVDAMYANLSATQRGIARTLTSQNSRTLAKLAAMSSKLAAQSVRAVDGAASNMVGKFGGLYSGQVAQKMDVAQANSEAVGTAALAGLQTAKGFAKAGDAAMAIQQAGVADAQAAAQYALAQASIARAQADADAVAALKAQQAAAGLNRSNPGLTGVATLASNISKALREGIRDALASGEPLNLLTVSTDVANKLGIPTNDQAQFALVRYLAQSIYSQKLYYGTEQSARGVGNTGRQDEIQAILDAVLMSYAGAISDGDSAKLRLAIEDYLTKLYPKPLPPPTGDKPPPEVPLNVQQPTPPKNSNWNTPVASTPPYEENLAAGIELYILANPGASREEAERKIREVLAQTMLYPWAAASTPDYVTQLRQYKNS